MEFRTRDYRAEEAAVVSSLPRSPAFFHPLSPSISSQVDNTISHQNDFYDPLCVHDVDVPEPTANVGRSSSTKMESHLDRTSKVPRNQWALFRTSVLQKFSYDNLIAVSLTSDILTRGKNVPGRIAKIENMDEPSKFIKDDIKFITRQEYVSRIHEIRDEIIQSWRDEDRVTALKLTIKVTRLLMDTSSPQFYPALFILVTDILDVLGDMVLIRIKDKAKCVDDEIPLAGKNVPSDICSDAKEICNNWFRKIGSIRELLPRIYLELSILHCWHFLQDQPVANVQRLMLMLKGIADPIAFVYCHLYLTRQLQDLYHDCTEFLMMSMRDVSIFLKRLITEKDAVHDFPSDKRELLLITLEPAINWIMKCISMGNDLGNDVLVQLGLATDPSFPCERITHSSIILHYLLKELPAEIIHSHALNIIKTFELCNDNYIGEHINCRLLGIKLSDSLQLQKDADGSIQEDIASSVLSIVFEMVSKYSQLKEYLLVVDAFMDIVIQLEVDHYILLALEGVSKRALGTHVSEEDNIILQSILIKLINCWKSFDILFLNHFVDLVDLLSGDSRDMVNICLLSMLSRKNRLSDSTIIQFFFEVCRFVHERIDPLNLAHEYQKRTRLISHFVKMVDFGPKLDEHLMFLVQCRSSLGKLMELQELLVRMSNFLAMAAFKGGRKNLSFIKACIAFSEVTIPSIVASLVRIKLYLETAEVSLLCNLVVHAKDFIFMTISLLEDTVAVYGSQPSEMLMFFSLICKLCSMLAMVPVYILEGHPTEGIGSILNILMSLVSRDRMTSNAQIKILCAIILMLASLSQSGLLRGFGIKEVSGSYLFTGDTSHKEELISLSMSVVAELIEVIESIHHVPERGRLALVACNCLASAFKASYQLSSTCSNLIEIAKSSLHPNERYLVSTLNFLNERNLTIS